MRESKQYAGFLLLELLNVGFDMGEIIGQLLASAVESGMNMSEAVGEGAAGLNRFAELSSGGQSQIWDDLVPGAGREPRWQVVEAGAALDIGQMGENIKLPYGLDYHKGETVYHCPQGAEFFLDEHGHQWIKFFPSNGPDAKREHMFKVYHSTDWIVRRT
jgi:hypothetical protein